MKTPEYFKVIASTVALLFILILGPSAPAEGNSSLVSFKKDTGSVVILIGDRAVATYVFEDPAIPRPYFCQVKTLGGVQVTRIHPPDPVINKGNDDHETFHPGIWLAFGDLGGRDFWRNKAHVHHVKFIGPFVEEDGLGRFTVLNSYTGIDGQENGAVCEETCTYSIHTAPSGYFLIARSEFRSDKADFSFGDQEEMGFGVRLNTPLTVKFGSGKILNSEDGENEKGTWGKQAKWCATTGTVEGKIVSVALIPGPGNFRPSWFHTRDYGLMVANPFGKKSMTGPEDAVMAPDATLVRKGEVFKLGFGVWVSDTKPGVVTEAQAAYEKCLTLFGPD